MQVHTVVVQDVFVSVLFESVESMAEEYYCSIERGETGGVTLRVSPFCVEGETPRDSKTSMISTQADGGGVRFAAERLTGRN